MKRGQTCAGRLVLIDVGNTSTGIALCEGGRVRMVGRLPTGHTSDRAVSECLRQAADRRPFMGAVLCSVVPAVNGVWNRALGRFSRGPALVVDYRLELGIGIRYPRPATIGADRLANACAAASIHGVPSVVADFGTALTFDVVSADGHYVGGIIAPGLALMLDYLHERTALLPAITLSPVRRAVGRSTVEAMRIGGLVGYRGMVQALMTAIGDELAPARPAFCATGGLARRVVATLPEPIPVDPLLTFKGLRRIFELNVEARA